MTVLAIALALAGAGCYALAAQFQHGAVAAVAGPRGNGALARLVRQPRWLAGFALIGTGALVHACALGLAPLTVVQPVGVLAVVLIAVLFARSARLRPGAGTVLAIAGTTTAVGGFVALAAGDARSTLISDGSLLRTGLLAAAAVAVAVAAAWVLPGRARCLLLATGGGVAYGFVSVTTRLVAQRLTVGGWSDVPVPALLAVGAALGVGGVLIQLAYASGPPTVVVACLTVADPFFAVGIGAVLLGEGAATPAPVLAAQIVLAVSAAGGVAALARFHPDATSRSGGGHPGTAVSTADVRSTTARGKQMINTASRRPAGAEAHAGGYPTDGLRVVIGADTFPPDVNGAARFSYRLATGLAARGHDVHVLCPAPEGPPEVSTMDGVTVHRVRARRTPFHPTFRVCPPWQAAAAADALLADLTPDLVHIQSHFVVGRALSKAAPRHGVPLMATNHFMPENLFGYVRLPVTLHETARRLAWRDLVRVYGRAQLVTAPTPRAVDLLRANGVGGDPQPLSCGIDLDRFAAPDRDPAAVPTILFVGRLDAEKRVDELLRAAALLPAGTPYRIELVGQGSRRDEWQALATRLGIADRVTFRGYVSDEDLPAAYANADIFCIPGIAELQSLVTMEAMASGLPVLAADAMALPHLVHNGHNGWLYPPGDVTALSTRLLALLSDPDLRTRMGTAGRRLIAEHDVATTLSAFESRYAQLLGTHSTPTRTPTPTLVAA